MILKQESPVSCVPMLHLIMIVYKRYSYMFVMLKSKDLSNNPACQRV